MTTQPLKTTLPNLSTPITDIYDLYLSVSPHFNHTSPKNFTEMLYIGVHCPHGMDPTDCESLVLLQQDFEILGCMIFCIP